MKAEFWHERWEANQLGFHQSDVNSLLKTHWAALGVAPEVPVFVPLCGKSLDMGWLRRLGHPVVGIDISPIAIRDFFAEARLACTTRRTGELECSVAEGFTLYSGNFFDLEPEALAQVGACFDRASLIALPPELRRQYAEHMKRLLPIGTRTLLITLEYDQDVMSGPPHSVPISEVEALFAPSFSIETLWSSGDTAPTPRFQERGLDRWCETALILERRPQTA